ncbi:hypothetical protein OPV22_023519 [Ensete ventricosum]|uniref:non-specific serine/threonine protein kinase n=1 Tax=Ensete ventricosum TaxID=4639 RepID=A0AAV8QT36_ENSVE|nr:hypothetical protein OPV22_023519 [Ensete ventricosum]
MGNCWGGPVKTESTFRSLFASGAVFSCLGVNSKSQSREGKTLSGSSSKVSAASVPATPLSEDDILQSVNVKSFTFNELKTATRNFRPDSVLGEGGFGSVFKGWIDEHTFAAAKPGTGMVIAVKKLNQEGVQGHREWLTEVNYLGQLSHRHLVKLIGYCLEDEQRLLVYEFMPRGSLENHLFRRSSYVQPLSWNLRMKIALGAAKGLAFLHSDMAKVIYRDFKTSNVLLDSNYNAKLSDFGLAKDGPTDDKSHVSTRIMGTHGYAAPEYLATGHLTTKSDVYSFGVVLLEMLSGRRALDNNRPTGEHNLVEWARPYLGSKRKIFRVLDARLERQYSPDGARKAAVLAFQCLSLEASYRPTMDQVVAALEELQDATDIGMSPRNEQKSNGQSISSNPHKSTPRRRSEELPHRRKATRAVESSSASPSSHQVKRRIAVAC